MIGLQLLCTASRLYVYLLSASLHHSCNACVTLDRDHTPSRTWFNIATLLCPDGTDTQT